MIEKEQILDLIQPKLREDGYFPVSVEVKPGNRIEVLIDSKEGVPIEYCIETSRLIEKSLDRDSEDFELEVSSPGIGQPFKVKEQYWKCIGRPVEVLLPDGRTQKGVLEEVGDDGFVVKEEKKVKPEGKKKKELQVFNHRFRFDEVKKVKEILEL
ncbi:MAG: ribosome assembly cofactor RimP [Marinilabiliaceae bacterium]